MQNSKYLSFSPKDPNRLPPNTAMDKDDTMYFAVITGMNASVLMQKGEFPPHMPDPWQRWISQAGRRLGLSSVPVHGELGSVFG